MAADPLTTVVPRPLVPTPRQVAGGEAAPGYEPMPIGIEPRGRRSVRRAVAGLLDRVDVRRIAGPRTPIVVFLAIALFGRLDELIFLVIGPELVADFATGPALLGFVLAASQIVSYLVLPLYGYLVDRVRRVWLLRIAHVGGNLVSTTAAFAAGPLGFAGARGAAGLLGVSGELPQATYLADRYKGESFGRLVTTIAAAQKIGRAHV